MKARISKSTVDKLLCGKLLVDTEIRGFVARRLPNGTVTYGMRYRDKGSGQRRWIGLGVHGEVTPDQARTEAERRRGEIAERRDPLAEKQTTRAKRKTAVTLGNVVPVYLDDRKGEFRATVLAEQTRYLKVHWRPLHDIALNDIKRANVVAVIDAIAKERGRVAADRARTSLSAFFTWAIDRGYCDATPVTNIKARNQNGPRSRVLTEAELVAVWSGCLDDDYGRIIKLLILTGQRKSEIGDLDWREINADKRQIELAPSRVKNKREHLIPLADEALAILRGVSRRQGRNFVFGRGAGGFSGWSKSKRTLDTRLPKNMKAWTVHDIRRSVVTHLHERGFAQPHVVEAIVNHVSGAKAGVAGIYNKAVYLNERRRALDMWGKHIAALVAGRESNVVPLALAVERA